MIKFFDTEFTDEMKDAAIHALQNETYVMGESVHKFEEEFARYIGTKYAISVNSGYSALFLSLIALGISNKSKVITSTNSFIASANCILAVTATPILSDINMDDGNIEIDGINEKVDAIIPVHIYGNPCNFDAVKEYSEKYKIPIIEDACQAHGASFKGKKLGSIGEVGCFSFYPTKNMTVCGDGGMITTNNDEVYKITSSLRDNGRKSKTEHDRLGFTMRLNTVSAAIGRVQLKYLDKVNDRRRAVYQIYKKNINLDCLLKENKDGRAVYHQIVIKNKNREAIKEHLLKNEIGTMIHYPIPIHKQELYKKYNYHLPKSEEFSKEILSLPSHPLLSDNDAKIISEKINEVIS